MENGSLLKGAPIYQTKERFLTCSLAYLNAPPSLCPCMEYLILPYWAEIEREAHSKNPSSRLKKRSLHYLKSTFHQSCPLRGPNLLLLRLCCLPKRNWQTFNDFTISDTIAKFYPLANIGTTIIHTFPSTLQRITMIGVKITRPDQRPEGTATGGRAQYSQL